MKKNANKGNKFQDLFVQYFGVIFILFLILLAVWSFKQQTQDFSRDISTKHLSNVALQTANTVKMKVQDSISYLTGATGYFSGFDDLRCYQSLNMLDKLAKNGGFYGLRVVTPDGKGYASLQNVVDLSQRDYFKKAMCGEIGISNAFIVYAPIYRERRIVGCLCGLYDLNDLHDARISNEKMIRSHVFQKNGNFIIKSVHVTQPFLGCGNVWAAFQNVTFKDPSHYLQFYKNVQHEKSGSIEYNENGENHIAYYAPVGVNGWFTLQVISESSIEAQAQRINDMAFLLIFKIMVSFFILIFGIVYFNNKAQKTLLNINRQLDLLANTIPGGVHKCSSDEKGEFIFLSDGFIRMFGYSRNQIKEMFHNSFYKTIYESDRATVRKQLSHPKLGKVIELEYRVMTGSGQLLWMLNKLTLTQDEQGTYFYCVCLDITGLKMTQQELQMSNERFRISMANTSNVIFEYDMRKNDISFVSNTRSLYALPKVIQLFDDWTDWNGVMFPESVKDFHCALEKMSNGVRTASCLIKMHRSDGKPAWNQVTLTNIFNQNNKPIRAIGMLEDVTENKQAELCYQKEKQYQDAILADVQDIYEVNLTTDQFCVIYGKKRRKKKLDLPDQFSKAMPLLIEHLVHPKDQEQVKSTFSVSKLLCAFQNGESSVEYQYRNFDNEKHEFWVSNRVNLLKDPQTGDIKAFSYVRDIDQQKRKELKLKFQSERDSLTGLYNRAAAETKITKFLNSEELSQGGHGFLAIDLDNFKLVNDHLGHLAGDCLLKNISGIMKSVFRATDILARMGGDEFVVFMKGARSRQHILKKAQELVMALQIILPDNPNGSVSASIGVAFAPEHGCTFEQLYQKADQALYHVKRNGKNCCFLYDESIEYDSV